MKIRKRVSVGKKHKKHILFYYEVLELYERPLAESPEPGRAAATSEGCSAGGAVRCGVGGVDNMDAGRGENS